jgi:hypothetical protein
LQEQGIKYEEAKGQTKLEIESAKEQAYGKINIDLDGLKASTMRELRNRHYDNAVNTLIESIQNYWLREVSQTNV